jgi:anti-anti-sigma factor
MATSLTLHTERRDDGELVLIAVGEIDLSNIDAFNQALTAATAVAAGSEGRFTVELSDVEYLDSAAINALYAHAEHIHLIARPHLMSLLAISGLTELLTVESAPLTPEH